MSDFFERLGFPSPEQRDSIRFYFAKGLTYRARKILILACFFAGLILQIAMLQLWPGIPLILTGVALGLVKGYDSRVRLKSFKHDATWTEVPIEKFRDIETVRQKSKYWDRDALDVTNGLGCAALLILLALGLCVSLIAGAVASDIRVTLILAVDYLLMVLPFYFTGVRRALKQGNLVIKVDLLLKLYEYFAQNKIESETLVPMMLLARENENKTVPVDVKFQIRYKGLPPDRFYGLQGTVNINLVQGTSYAYFYCVIVAKPGFGLKEYASKVRQGERVTCEYQQQSEAEVLVIRHPTSKTAGYYTDDRACTEILSAAIAAARIIESESQRS
jgi:hypothetical protein